MRKLSVVLGRLLSFRSGRGAGLFRNLQNGISYLPNKDIRTLNFVLGTLYEERSRRRAKFRISCRLVS